MIVRCGFLDVVYEKDHHRHIQGPLVGDKCKTSQEEVLPWLSTNNLNNRAQLALSVEFVPLVVLGCHWLSGH